MDAQFVESQDFIEAYDVVIPELLASSEELSARPTDEQLVTAEEAVKNNTATRDELLEVRDEYVFLMNEFDARVIADGALLAEPATEALANVEAFTAGWDKASAEARTQLTDATAKLEAALKEYTAGELAEAEDAADQTDPTDAEEAPEATVTDLFSYEHQVSEANATEHQLATNLRVAFVDFIAANRAVTKSHDGQVAAEQAEAERIAAEAAAAAAAAAAQWEFSSYDYDSGGGSGGGSSSGGSGGGGGAHICETHGCGGFIPPPQPCSTGKCWTTKCAV